MKSKKHKFITMPQIITIAYAVVMAPLSPSSAPAAGAATAPPVSLSGADWWIHDDPAGTGASSGLNSASIPAAGWIPARVPGNIQADVEAAHKLQPVWYGATDPALYEVARKDWWYRKDFIVPATEAGKRLTLIFDGVDERCEVWLNGQKLGGNAGMFRRFEFDVSGSVLPGETNRLAVWVARMPEELVPLLVNSDGPGEKDPFGPFGFMTGVNKTRERLKDLKTPGNFSYDWAFNVWTLGIWKDARLEITGPARIDWTRVETALADDFTAATVTATLEVDSLTEGPAQASFRLIGPTQTAPQTVNAVLNKGRNLVTAKLSVPQPALWWPNGHGAQPLYTVVAELRGGDDSLNDVRSTRFGIRDIAWAYTEGAPTNYINRYQLVINGRPVRTIGTGLIHSGVFPACVSEHTLQLLHQAKACGMNNLRINGGGGGPLFPEAWFNLADELGIMIQYEFPIGNSTEGRPETNDVFLKNLEVTCRNIVKESRNHPSIIEYAGGNEMEWDETSKHPALQVMRRVAAEETARLFRATSPDLGGKHCPWDFDILGSNTGYGGSYAHYNSFLQSTKNPSTETMSYSEFGTCSPSHEEVWRRDAPIASQWPLDGVDDPVLIRKNATRSVFSPEHWLVKKRIDAVFGASDNLHDFIAAGQYLGADGLRYIYDELRRRGRRLANITSHCYSEPCPNLAGSYLVDFAGRTLMNYDFLKQALAPVSLALRIEDAFYAPATGVKTELFLVSDAPQPASGLRWKWLARDRRGTVFARDEGKADIKPLEVKSLGTLILNPSQKESAGLIFVELRLEAADGKLLTERLEIFGERDAAGPFAGLLKNRDADAHAADESVRGKANLAFVGNGAKPATASSSRPEPHHQAKGLNDGNYGYESSWIGQSPRSWLQIDLEKAATVGRFVLGRDRTGRFEDRAVDYLKIETSLDGQQWQPAFERNGLTALVGFGRGKSLHVEVSPVKARFVRATVEALTATNGLLACVDEFEVYAPANKQTEAMPRVQWGKPFQPVRRTTLEVKPSTPQLVNGQEVLELLVRNAGPMTALFCEPHPLLVYRTDLFIENNNCFIPPGESRIITIRASDHPRDGLSLAETGWWLSAWNADDVRIQPSDDAILSVGRLDQMSREFLGYFDKNQVKKGQQVLLKGNHPDAARLPVWLDETSTVRFEFTGGKTLAARAARLRIHTADQSEASETVVRITINGRTMERTLPRGIGIQRRDPAHLAFPATAVFDLTGSDLRPGKNSLTVGVVGDGWFSWDSLDLVLMTN